MRGGGGTPHFLTVMALLLIAQFIDRGPALLIPLDVAHLPGVTAIAAISGLIISVAAVAAAAAAAAMARFAEVVPAGRLLAIQFVVGGVLGWRLRMRRGCGRPTPPGSRRPRAARPP